MRDDLATLLRDQGLQVTAQRLAVLRAVSTRPHCTADQIADDVRSEIGAISKQAVYDALRLLTDKRLIRRVDLGGAAALYDPRVDDHHHAVCRTCRKTVDVDCTADESPCLTASDLDYHIEEAEVVLWGTCPDCLPGTSATSA